MNFEDPFTLRGTLENNSDAPHHTEAWRSLEHHELAIHDTALVSDITDSIRYRLTAGVVYCNPDGIPVDELSTEQQEELARAKEMDIAITEARWKVAGELAQSEVEQEIFFLTIDYNPEISPAENPIEIDGLLFHSIGNDSTAEYYAGYDPYTGEQAIAYSLCDDPEKNLEYSRGIVQLLEGPITPLTRRNIMLEIQAWRKG